MKNVTFATAVKLLEMIFFKFAKWGNDVFDERNQRGKPASAQIVRDLLCF